MIDPSCARSFMLAVAALVIAAAPCLSDDLSTQPFEVRLWSAMSRSVSSTDAIGRQASVAYLSGSSDNPAGVDLRDVRGEGAGTFFCAGTHHIVFSNGAWIAAADGNAFLRWNRAGTLLVGYNHILMPDGQTQQGFNDYLRNSELVVKYGRAINQKAYVGVGARLRDMKLDHGDLFMGAPRNTHNDSFAGNLSIGGMWRPNQNWTLGLLTEVGWIGSDIDGQVHLPGFGSVPFQLDLTTQTVNVKAGLGWRISSALTIYGDAQYFHLGNSMSTVNTGRYYFGGDIRLMPRIALIVGSSVDNMARASASAGISINLSKPSLLKVTYQHNPLPEIRQEFGTGHLLSASIVFGF